MALFVSLVSVLSILAQRVLTVISQQIQIDLAKTLSSGSEVVVTSDPSYRTNVTQRWTIYAGTYPTCSVAAKPSTVEEVQKLVQFATQNNFSLFATGGGHGYFTTLSSVKDALNIDPSNFRKVGIDASSNTMTVGAASIFADMYDPLYAAGKQMRKSWYIPALDVKSLHGPASGGSSSPSIISVTLGGGKEFLIGVHGLLIDSALSIEIVSGSGEILSACPSQNADLFWGLHGAGVNFGIITSATYRIYDALNGGMVYNADLVFDAEQNGTIFQILSTYQDSQDDKLALTVRSVLANDVVSSPVLALLWQALLTFS
jgi:FAD/FMN-containing dehydrogenase